MGGHQWRKANVESIFKNDLKSKPVSLTPTPGKTMETFLSSWMKGNHQMDQRWIMSDPIAFYNKTNGFVDNRGEVDVIYVNVARLSKPPPTIVLYPG